MAGNETTRKGLLPTPSAPLNRIVRRYPQFRRKAARSEISRYEMFLKGQEVDKGMEVYCKYSTHDHSVGTTLCFEFPRGKGKDLSVDSVLYLALILIGRRYPGTPPSVNK